ncbi:MAG: GDSL-type esterase/lipase family protein [Chitinophagaceae bacterium]|nr:GDSL-type esterase/lipase family protein [Chitinophagaceae bacterium]
MKTLLVFVFASLVSVTAAQPAYDTNFRYYYYDQKLSFFEKSDVYKPEIVWLGDSITDGCEWAELFPGKKILNRGISADITFGVIYRLPEITKRKPRKIFILIGINDIARNIPDSVILKNYETIIALIRSQSPRTKIYFQSLLPTNNEFDLFKNHQNKTEHILAVNRQLEKICRTHQVHFINLYPHFTDANGKLDKKFTNDGLHLTGEGYLRWKTILLQQKIL